MLEFEDILSRIPHRPPFLFIDRVESLHEGISATGLTTFSGTEPIFEGHFPGEPIVPGVILIECIAQVAAILFSTHPRASAQASSPGVRYLAKVERAVFKTPVRPGDTIQTEVSVVKKLGSLAKVGGRIRKGDIVVMEGEIILYSTSERGGG